jgi:hypothetical protein
MGPGIREQLTNERNMETNCKERRELRKQARQHLREAIEFLKELTVDEWLAERGQEEKED